MTRGHHRPLRAEEAPGGFSADVLLLAGDLHLGVALARVASRVGTRLGGLVALTIVSCTSSPTVARELLTPGMGSAVNTSALSFDLVETLFSVFQMILSRLSD